MNYVLSDIHGQYEIFMKMLDLLNLSDTDTLYILGDCIDRGPESYKVMEVVMQSKNMKMLLGNHEYMMIDKFDDPRDFDKAYLWAMNGSGTTLNSFKKVSEEKIKEVIDFCKSLPIEFELNINGQDFKLVHGSYIPKKKGFSEESRKYHTVWDRYSSYSNASTDAIVVFGHTPTSHYQKTESGLCEIWQYKNLIGIDCGLAKLAYGYKDGQLGCLRLEDLKEFYAS